MLTVYQKPVTFGNVLKFTLPTIAMSVFQSLYTMVDGVFVANLVGSNALAALTLLSPLFSVVYALSALLASGGSAVVMRKMGEGKTLEARQDFTMLLLVNLLLGVTVTALGLLFAQPLSQIFNTSAEVSQYCYEYLFYYTLFAIPALLFSNLQIYIIASNSSGLALGSALAGGFTNIILDYLFIKVWGLGLKGAAIATGLGMLIPCVIIAIYFCGSSHLLHFVRPKFRKRVLGKTITNGTSEFATNLVTGITMLLFNYSLLRYVGEDGVAASTIIFYVFGFLCALYMGYVYGVAPMFSYYYGEGSQDKMHKLSRINLCFILVLSLLSALGSALGSQLLVGIFAQPGTAVYQLAVEGNRLFAIGLLFVGFNTYSSGMFTALSNGLISALISLGRTCVFLTGALLLLPRFLGLEGIWLAVPVAEALTILLAAGFYLKYQKRYGY